MVMEAEQSHDLLSVSWRPRRASAVVQSECEGLRTRGVDGVGLSPRAEKTSVLAQTVQEGSHEFSLNLPFVYVGPQLIE